MKQVSVSVPDYIYKALVFLTDVSGKSQSAFCTPWLEKGVMAELKAYKETIESIENIGIDLDEDE